jgi:hypothetical protein
MRNQADDREAAISRMRAYLRAGRTSDISVMLASVAAGPPRLPINAARSAFWELLNSGALRRDGDMLSLSAAEADIDDAVRAADNASARLRAAQRSMTAAEDDRAMAVAAVAAVRHAGHAGKFSDCRLASCVSARKSLGA